MIVMHEFGRHLVVEPFVETVVLAGGLLESLGSEEQKRAMIPDLTAGAKIWALAWSEKGSRFEFANVATSARREGQDYVLTGEKAAVLGAPWADYLIVSARTSGDRRDRDGAPRTFICKASRPSTGAVPRKSPCVAFAANCWAGKAKELPRWRPAASEPSVRFAPKRSAR